LKKRTKKLLLIEVCVGSNVRPNLQKFLLLFQKEALSCLLRVNLYAAWYYAITSDYHRDWTVRVINPRLV